MLSMFYSGSVDIVGLLVRDLCGSTAIIINVIIIIICNKAPSTLRSTLYIQIWLHACIIRYLF